VYERHLEYLGTIGYPREASLLAHEFWWGQKPHSVSMQIRMKEAAQTDKRSRSHFLPQGLAASFQLRRFMTAPFPTFPIAYYRLNSCRQTFRPCHILLLSKTYFQTALFAKGFQLHKPSAPFSGVGVFETSGLKLWAIRSSRGGHSPATEHVRLIPIVERHVSNTVFQNRITRVSA
jgi:hypothetical protein